MDPELLPCQENGSSNTYARRVCFMICFYAWLLCFSRAVARSHSGKPMVSWQGTTSIQRSRCLKEGPACILVGFMEVVVAVHALALEDTCEVDRWSEKEG